MNCQVSWWVGLFVGLCFVFTGFVFLPRKGLFKTPLVCALSMIEVIGGLALAMYSVWDVAQKVFTMSTLIVAMFWTFYIAVPLGLIILALARIFRR